MIRWSCVELSVLRAGLVAFGAALALTAVALAAPRSPAPPSRPAEQATRRGTPVVLGHGVRETVSQIMERQRFRDWEPGRDAEREEARLRPVPPTVDPASPRVSRWPPPSAAPRTTEGARENDASPAAPLPGPPRLALDPNGVSFRAVSIAAGESPFAPPDSMGDIGPTQILVHVNGRIKVFDRNGVVGSLNSGNNPFWESVREGLRMTDPSVRYDRLSGRWFLVMMNVAPVNNVVAIAVSSGPTITGSSSFTFFSFHVGIGPGESTLMCDYPSLGVDANALTIGCNMYSGSSFQHSTVYVVRKSSLLSGGPLVVTPFVNVTGGITAGPWSPRGVHNDDPLATESYFVGVDIGLLGPLALRRVTDPGGTPTLSGNIFLTVPATSLPLLQPAQSSTVGLDPLDDRLLAAAIRTNRITGVKSLWTAHSVAVNTSCVAATSGAGRRNAARWYEIGDLGAATPTLLQAGTLCDAAATNPLGFIYPSLIGTGQGHVALGASYAAPNAFAGVATASRRRDDPAGTLGSALVPQAGLAPYTVVDPSGFNRWGDYSFSGVDPNDDMTVWTFQEYADAPPPPPANQNAWAVRVIQLRAPPPPLPASASPAEICAGAAATQVTITGDAPAGEEFFDPGPDTGGPGFAAHLSASACPGVTVTTAAFVDPTHVTVALDAIAAVPGTCGVTVTNPDGQSATGAGLLAIVSSPAEVNDSLTLSDAGGLTSLSWSDAPGEFNVYRGSRSGSSWIYNHTCFAAHLAAQAASDDTIPPPGAVLYYLVGRANACGESAPGRDSQGAPNPIPASCS